MVMKNFLSCKKTLIVLLVITIISLGFYAYMLARPIFYGMDYRAVVEYEGGVFEGTMKFKSDGTMVNKNTNFEEEMKSFYYYKDGYVFYTMASTDEDYEKEVAEINENFDEAIKTPFYADKINAFKLVAAEDDGYSTVYNCASAVLFAVIGGVIEVILIGLIFVSFIVRKKSNV